MDEGSITKKEFEKNVEWLKKAVSTEDIYELTQQLAITAEYFMDKWLEWVNGEEEMARDSEVYSRIRALVQLHMLRKYDTDEFIKEFIRRKNAR